MKKTIIWIMFAILSGAVLGKVTFDKYSSLKVDEVISYNTNTYMLKYKTYSSKKKMEEDVKKIDRYIYIKEGNDITVYLAITTSKDNIKKIKKIYDEENIKTSIKRVDIENEEFIQNLNEYEKLLTAAYSKSSLITIENQILSCYEKLVVNDE
ncbi:MAG: hypothetical protein MR296_01455 [Tenericutes bacterium]|nr:hypothetical protein [Mycoplasmatota bacterium]